MQVEGEKRLNGREYSLQEIKSAGGYVMQDDVLNAHLTVEETLMYAARLRLAAGTTTNVDFFVSRTHDIKEMKSRVEDVMTKMGLTHARDTIIGSPAIKGISGMVVACSTSSVSQAEKEKDYVWP